MSDSSDERYEIQAKIGEGGVGAVYRAYDKQLRRDVAIKRVLPDGGYESEDEATKHLLKEATSVSSVQHPNIVTVFDSGVDEDGPYVVMELLDGRTLDEMVERSILTLTDFKEVAVQMQEALIAAQDLKLVHRDLKPSNVMVTWLPSGRFQVKIVDFGLAKFSPKPSLQTINHGDSVFGSIFFMAPEQFERTELDQRTDMYATGCLYYFCLTGQYPFSGETAAEVMESHLNHNVAPLKQLRPDVPDWLNDWVMWHINRDLAHRPNDARESLELFMANEKAAPLAEAAAAPLPTSAPVLQTPRAAVPNHTTASVPSASGSKLAFPGAKKTGTQSITERIKTAAQTVKTNPKSATAPQPIAPPQKKSAAVDTSAEDKATTAESTADTPSSDAPAPKSIAPAETTPPAADEAPTPAATAPKLTINRGAASAPSLTVNKGVSKAPTQPAQASVAARPVANQPTGSVQVAKTATTTQQVTAQMLGTDKKGLGVKGKIIIAAVLAAAVAIVGLLVIDRTKTQKDYSRVDYMLKEAMKVTTSSIPMSGRDVELLLASLQDNPEPQFLANYYQALIQGESNDGSSIDTLIMDELLEPGTAKAVRQSLLEGVLRARGSEEVVTPALELASSSEDAAISKAAVSAVSKSAKSDDVPALINLMAFNPHSGTRLEAEKVIKRILRRDEDTPYIAQELIKAYETANSENAKRAFLRTLGASGAREARAPLESALASEEIPNMISAVSAIGEWPNDNFYDPLILRIATVDNSLFRGEAFNAALKILGADRERSTDELASMWESLNQQAKTSSEKQKIINGIVFVPGEFALEILQELERGDDPSVSGLADRALSSREGNDIK